LQQAIKKLSQLDHNSEFLTKMIEKNCLKKMHFVAAKGLLIRNKEFFIATLCHHYYNKKFSVPLF